MVKFIRNAALLLALAGSAQATSIESVSLLKDAAGEPGEEVSMFDPGNLIQHFKITLDEMKIGQHRFMIEFWADETTQGSKQKLTEFETDGLIANTITAQISLPNRWPTGWYRLVVRMDGEEIGTHRYVVSKPWKDQRIVSWTLYQDDGKDGEGPEVKAFTPSDRKQHFELQTDGFIQRGAQLKIIFSALNADGGASQEIKSIDYRVPSDDSVFNILTSFISLPSNWAVGDYQIAVYEGSRLLGKHVYRVE